MHIHTKRGHKTVHQTAAEPIHPDVTSDMLSSLIMSSAGRLRPDSIVFITGNRPSDDPSVGVPFCNSTI